MMKLGRAIAVLLLLTAASGCEAGQAGDGTVASASTLVPVTIKSATKSHRILVEMARTPEEQARGLMFRESLANDRGMLFPLTPPRYASFWMKNTVIPLDMIFIRADGSIARIAAETIPYSLEPERSDEPVAAVLELAGGNAARLGIAEDDIVSWVDPVP